MKKFIQNTLILIFFSKSKIIFFIEKKKKYIATSFNDFNIHDNASYQAH